MECFDKEHKDKIIKFQKGFHSVQRKKKQTTAREHIRNIDIETIRSFFPDAKSILCCGARDNSEVQTFISAGYDAEGIDINGASKYIKEMGLEEVDKYFDKDAFDILYLSHVLEHLSDAEKVLPKIREISRLGAVVILPLTPNRPDPSVKHPTIFEVMKLKCNSESNIGVLQDLSKVWDDFRGFGSYSFLGGSFRRGVTDYCEVCLFFRFN